MGDARSPQQQQQQAPRGPHRQACLQAPLSSRPTLGANSGTQQKTAMQQKPGAGSHLEHHLQQALDAGGRLQRSLQALRPCSNGWRMCWYWLAEEPLLLKRKRAAWKPRTQQAGGAAPGAAPPPPSLPVPTRWKAAVAACIRAGSKLASALPQGASAWRSSDSATSPSFSASSASRSQAASCAARPRQVSSSRVVGSTQYPAAPKLHHCCYTAGLQCQTTKAVPASLTSCDMRPPGGRRCTTASMATARPAQRPPDANSTLPAPPQGDKAWRW